MFSRLARFGRGLSETTAIVILLGVAIALAISFTTYIQVDYGKRQDLLLLQRVIENEKTNTIVRLIAPEGGGMPKDAYVMFLRRLDNGNRVYIFLYDGSSYVNCRNVIKSVSGGRIAGTYVHDVSKIAVLSGGSTYSFKYYAKASGYPDTGFVEVCAIEIDRNAIVKFSFAEELKPIARGDNLTTVTANNRRWRLYGVIEFRVAYLGNPSGTHLYVNGTWYQLKVDDIVGIDVDTETGKLDLSRQQLPNGKVGAWILALNVFAREIRVNNAVLARYTSVRITSDVAIDLQSLKSSLAIEIYPTPSGFTRIVYGGRTIVDHWNNGNYIRVENLKLGLDPRTHQLVIQLDPSNLYVEGIAEAIYVSEDDTLARPIDRFSVFVITYVNNVPYLVNVYDYRFS